jgi:hypothetical protein
MEESSMKKFFVLIPLMAILVSPAWSIWDPISQAPEIVAGWTPAQASDFQGAKIQYAEAAQQYGYDSPEATRAHNHLLAMSRALGADEIGHAEPKPTQSVTVDFRSLTVFADQRDITQK